MSTENDVARSLRSWMKENRHEDANRILDVVFDQLPATPQRRAGWLARRFPVMNTNIARLGVATAAVVLAVIIGINFLPGSNTPGGPDVTPSPSEAAPSPTPADFSAQEGGGTALAPGSYVITYLSPMRITVTVPAGWSKGYLDWALFSTKASLSIAFMTVDNLYVDPCAADPRLREPAVGPTVNDLATALGDVPGLQATAPSDVTVAGFTGKQMDLTASETWCGGEPKMWETSGGVDSPAGGPMRLWILDVDGTRLVLSVLDDGAGARLAEVQAIVDSIQIEP
jgi:hypothetical protein